MLALCSTFVRAETSRGKASTFTEGSTGLILTTRIDSALLTPCASLVPVKSMVIGALNPHSPAGVAVITAAAGEGDGWPALGGSVGRAAVVGVVVAGRGIPTSNGASGLRNTISTAQAARARMRNGIA